MPRGKGNRNNHSQQQQEFVGGPPPGFDPRFQQPLTGDPTVDFPPPGFSQSFYGAPPPGFNMQFHPPIHIPELRHSMQVMQMGEPLDSQQGEQVPGPDMPSSRQYNRGYQQSNRGVPFSGPSEECILCCQRSDVFGIGPCKHPACIECMIRMRCLGESTTCHACREEITLMSFVQKPKKWDDYTIPECKIIHSDCEKFGIGFETQHVADVYNNLNAFSCHVCRRNGAFADFPSFQALKQHMGNAHQLFFCHICLDHLNVLPKNHRTFTKKDLQLHMTGAKSVVRGVNGHPKCDFCALRFFDVEELYKHSRKEHFFCSLCAETMGTNSFFKTMKQLHVHYKQKHKPCLEPECLELGIVFNDEFDLNVHKTERHSSGNRNIPVDFQFSRNQSRYNEPPTRVVTQRQGVTIVPSNRPAPPPQPTNIIPSAQATGQNVQLVHRPAVVQQHNFPTLPAARNPLNAFGSNSNWRADASSARTQAQQRPEPPNPRTQISSAAHFPTLGGPTSSSAGAAAKSNIWSGGKAVAIVKKAPKPVEKPVKTERRRIVVPDPQIWTEQMRMKLEARAQGLPEPPDIEPKLPEPPPDGTFKKKEKKPKKKTVGLDALKKKLETPAVLSSQSTASKFDILSGRN